MTQKRKQLSKKIRFEVLKRDKFTCQYCGRSAPDVLLQVDHIKPVSKGGKNDLLNLVTSCSECNLGKGARELTDDSMVKKQERQIKELADKNEQLEMLLKWRKELQNFEDKEVDAVCSHIIKISDWGVNDSGRKEIKRLIKRFSLQQVLDAVDIAFERYYDGSDRSWETAFDKIGGVCYNKSLEHDNGTYYYNYLSKACRDKYGIYYDSELIKDVVDGFISNDEGFENIKDILKSSKNWSVFKEQIFEEYVGDGNL